MNYLKVKEHIHELAIQARRDPNDITLITVSKGHSWIPEVESIYAAGCRQFGENRLQEALPKITESPLDISWHFIGSLQKNKVQQVIKYFNMIHSVDNLSLAEKIHSESQKINMTTSILLQVNTSKEISKHGFSEEEVLNSFEVIRSLSNIRVEGLMTMAPLTENQSLIRESFKRLRLLKEHLGLFHLSMGMSHDYPIAIEEGATLLRLGRVIFNSSIH